MKNVSDESRESMLISQQLTNAFEAASSPCAAITPRCTERSEIAPACVQDNGSRGLIAAPYNTSDIQSAPQFLN